MRLQRPGEPSYLLPQVLLGNFAVLQTLDPGYFGQGIYLTMDPEYAIEEYGRGAFGLTRVPLLICVVVVGNTLPVMPLRTPQGQWPPAHLTSLFVCLFVCACDTGYRKPELGGWLLRQGDRWQGRLARSARREGPGCQPRSRRL